MGPTEKLIKEFAHNGHPLGNGILLEEVPVLIEALRQRLGASADELDLSPASLKKLEQYLYDLYQSIQARGLDLSNDDLIQMVREIAAYTGEVLVRNAGGQWGKEPQTLWSTEVVIGGPWEVIKDRRYVSSRPASFIIGGEAAWAWDMISTGKKPNLYRTYRDARSKRLRERLPKA
jgi:hypothetical protein